MQHYNITSGLYRVKYQDGTPRMVTHLGTGPAQRRVTWLTTVHNAVTTKLNGHAKRWITFKLKQAAKSS